MNRSSVIVMEAWALDLRVIIQVVSASPYIQDCSVKLSNHGLNCARNDVHRYTSWRKTRRKHFLY